MTNRATPLDRLVKRLLRWLRLLPEATRPLGTELDRQDWGVLWRLESDEPGVISSWAINEFKSDALLTINLISIAALREDLGRGRHYKRSTDPFRTNDRPFSEQIKAYLQSHDLNPLFCTHIIFVVWRSTLSAGSANNGRRYQVSPIAQIPGDYQGAFTGSGDRYALRICDRIGRQLLRKAKPGSTKWRDVVKSIDWVSLVEHHAKSAIGQSHTLQVKSARLES